jgi:hypothetical protein
MPGRKDGRGFTPHGSTNNFILPAVLSLAGPPVREARRDTGMLTKTLSGPSMVVILVNQYTGFQT